MTALRNDWIKRNPKRAAPDVDFGRHWTRNDDPHTQWTLSYNLGSGELYAHTNNDIEVLGAFDDPDDIERALPGWAARCEQPGSLDWARTAILTPTPQPAPERSTNTIYGVVLATDGTGTLLHEPVTIDEVSDRIGDTLTAPTLPIANGNTPIVMFVADTGHARQHPVNRAATLLYGTGWPILGDTIIVADNDQPLPGHLVDRLRVYVDIDPGRAEPSAALEWDDHLTDRERDYPPSDLTPDHDLDLDDDLDLDLDDDLDRSP